MEYPRGDADLAALLDAGVLARTVVWLGELRDYTSGPDGGDAVLGRLAHLFETQDHVFAVTTVWPAHWDSYLDAARTRDGLGPDAGGTAGRILSRLPVMVGREPAVADLARGGVVDIPAAFTPAEVIEAASTDPRLADAAKAAAIAKDEGQITQYLAGVPDLLARLHGANRYGQAIILAAMDAARLGCQGPLPTAYLTEAAVGYLTSRERTIDAGAWAGLALAWATEKLKGAVQAVRPVAPLSGTGTAGYRPADYLEQHGQGVRQHQIGTTELWQALAAHVTGPADLTRLAHAAEDYGLYQHAATLLTQASGSGDCYAALRLLDLLRRAVPDAFPRAARWAAGRVTLDNSEYVGYLLHTLRSAQVSDAVTTLLSRDPAAHASLDSPRAVGALLAVLCDVGARDAAAILADRAAAQASLDSPVGIYDLMRRMSHAGFIGAAFALADRAAIHASLHDPDNVARFLEVLSAWGGAAFAAVLADRAVAAHVSLDNPALAAMLLYSLREAGADDIVTSLLSRDPAAQASLDDPLAVVDLLMELRKAGASDAATILADRAAADTSLDGGRRSVIILVGELRKAGASDAAAILADRAVAHASLGSPGAVADLLGALGDAGADDAVAALLARDPVAHASLGSPGAVADLLGALRDAGADDAVAALLARDPAAHASVDDPWAVVRLLRELRKAGTSDAAGILADRAVAHASLDNPKAVADLLGALRDAGADDAVTALACRAANAGIARAFVEDPASALSHWQGREPDGSLAQWTWQEPAASGLGGANEGQGTRRH